MTISPDFNDNKTLEKYSSAFTLSDMEIFIFPELFYPLVLANIMSPIIWEWKKEDWFKDIQKKSFTYKVNRVKQYIMEHYVFNLDLETWGMTTKDKEINRFKDFFPVDVLRQSNALFGYEGDKYYFDIDIRKHFGLDKYNTDVIPYWKTETVEAMTAFKYKEGFPAGAGECVSLAALYAAAMFIVAGIPLEEMFLMSTPLHSQNFINSKEGVLTNNRRIVTKNMWFNGTVLSARARRALENEKVTIVSHISGYIHTVFPKATIDAEKYKEFSGKLKAFLKTKISAALFVNFLRYDSEFRKYFQYVNVINGRKKYIALEKIFEYEHTSKNAFADKSREILLKEIDSEEYSLSPLENRVFLNDIEVFLDANAHMDCEAVRGYFINKIKEIDCTCNKEEIIENIHHLFKKLENFIRVNPRLPETNKEFVNENSLTITATQSREEIINYIKLKAETEELALLSLYALRQMDIIDWNPFLKAAFERNPVSVEGLKGQTTNQVYELLQTLPNDSVYSDNRLALPDEVWNFNRGDGIEKALLLANFILHDNFNGSLNLNIENNKVILKANNNQYEFVTQKELTFNKDLSKIVKTISSTATV
ncbi:MAG: hypothetical protein HY951_15635 [Bacteroidia bacterium]|nr:hypothetical protein [Bacteroidia bacterium]